MSSSRTPKKLNNPYDAVPQEETGPASRSTSKAVIRLLALGGLGAGAAGLQVAGAGAAHADPFGGGSIFSGGDLSGVNFSVAENIQIPEMTTIPNVPVMDVSTVTFTPPTLPDIPPPPPVVVETPPPPVVVETPPPPVVETPPVATGDIGVTTPEQTAALD
ncbi:MAG: hypothetical protein AVDCRST_MAG41-1761, partial [uncultured Corynebacteriales bacterium]